MEQLALFGEIAAEPVRVIPAADICPNDGGALYERPRSQMSPEQEWCGTWLCCPNCRYSILIISEPLQQQLAEMYRSICEGFVAMTPKEQKRYLKYCHPDIAKRLRRLVRT